jgi:hypothetical protein
MLSSLAKIPSARQKSGRTKLTALEPRVNTKGLMSQVVSTLWFSDTRSVAHNVRHGLFNSKALASGGNAV